MKLPSSGFKVAIYIILLLHFQLWIKSREEIHIYSFIFFGKKSAANSQNGGPGVCHFLVLVWAWKVASFSKMVSTPIVLQIPWCVGGPQIAGLRRPEGGWKKHLLNGGYLGKFWKTIGTSDMLSKNLQWTKQASKQFFFELYSIFPAAQALPTPLGWREASKAATCGTELVPTWRIIPLGKVVRNSNLSRPFGRGTITVRRLTITMIANHLLNRMMLQEGSTGQFNINQLNHMNP